MGEHLLLTVLGTNTNLVRYTLGGRDREACVAPAALIELLPPTERPDRVLAICTPRAKEKSLPALQQALSNGCPVDAIDVSSDSMSEDVNRYLQTVCENIPATPGVELSVDVTHGYRHLSFLTYVAVLYLASFRAIKIRGAYYGLLRDEEKSPFIDLRPLLELPSWAHALQVLHATGSTLPIAEMLRAAPVNQSTANIVRELERYSAGYLSGLPIELGRQASAIRKDHLRPLEKLLKRHRLPLVTELVTELDSIMGRFAYDSPPPSTGWKRGVELSEQELMRQAILIDELLKSENVASALGLMREWTVSWVTWCRGDPSNWLDSEGTRREAANLLNAIAAISDDGDLRARLSDQQIALGEFWGGLRNLRNGYHHHGMRKQDMIGHAIERDFDFVKTYWAETLSQRPVLQLSIGQAPDLRVLVSPLGKSPGVLFSALGVCMSEGDEPDLCIVICSKESQGSIQPAVQQANYSGRVVSFCLDDPYGGGHPEIRRALKGARVHLIGAMDVAINITGGTTLMGLAVEAVAIEARKLACPVRRFGLIDSRPPSQQAAEPYLAAKPFWLEGRGRPAHDS